MPEFNRIFLDTTPVIYFIQQNEYYFEKVAKIFAFLNETNIKVVSSDITTAEACVHAYRIGKFEWLNDFNNLMNLLNVEILHTSEQIAIKTAQIRAKYDKFKTPDSLQLATAVISNCDIFLTNDKRLCQFDEIKCVTIDDFNFDSEETEK